MTPPACGRCGKPATGQARINGVRHCSGGPRQTSCYEQAMRDKNLTRTKTGATQ